MDRLLPVLVYRGPGPHPDRPRRPSGNTGRRPRANEGGRCVPLALVAADLPLLFELVDSRYPGQCLILWLFGLGWAAAESRTLWQRAAVTAVALLTIPGSFDDPYPAQRSWRIPHPALDTHTGGTARTPPNHRPTGKCFAVDLRHPLAGLPTLRPGRQSLGSSCIIGGRDPVLGRAARPWSPSNTASVLARLRLGRVVVAPGKADTFGSGSDPRPAAAGTCALPACRSRNSRLA